MAPPVIIAAQIAVMAEKVMGGIIKILSRDIDRMLKQQLSLYTNGHIVASELKDPICHSNECQIGSFSSVATCYCRAV